MIRVHRREGGLEARGHEQVLQVFVAAVGQEINNLFVRPDGVHDLLFLERAGLVLVDHLEDLTGRAEELCRKFLICLGRRAICALALLRQRLQPLGEAAVDRLLPCVADASGQSLGQY